MGSGEWAHHAVRACVFLCVTFRMLFAYIYNTYVHIQYIQ